MYNVAFKKEISPGFFIHRSLLYNWIQLGVLLIKFISKSSNLFVKLHPFSKPGKITE
jgi:hypothetical protein